MAECKFTAEKKSLREVLQFVESELEQLGCSMKSKNQIWVAVEELYVNVASYAYQGQTGEVWISVSRVDATKAKISIKDKGVPFNPFEKEDPDITLSAQDRKIGGLGIFMVKKMMDEVYYEYIDGQNIVTLIKTL